MDIRSVFTSIEKGIDYKLDALGLLEDNSLESLIVISLFTDKRADEAEDDFKRGWWADSINERELGSKLWLLKREKQLTSVLFKAKQYASEALQWLVDDGLCTRISVTTNIVKRGVLAIVIELFDTSNNQSNYSYHWGVAA